MVIPIYILCIFTVILCPNLTAPLNGSVYFTAQNLTVGVTAFYSCDSGYSLVGNGTIMCEQDDQADTVGVWSDDPPTCDGEFTVVVSQVSTYLIFTSYQVS